MRGRSLMMRGYPGMCGHRGHGHVRGRFFGMDVEEMGRASRVGVSAVVISAVAISGLLILALAPSAWWIVTIYGWVVFPAMGLLGSGRSGSPSRMRRPVRPAAPSPERQLLDALERNGSLTPARAAMETSLSVSEAEKILGELAGEGYIEVRASGGGIFYSMWDGEEGGR